MGLLEDIENLYSVFTGLNFRVGILEKGEQGLNGLFDLKSAYAMPVSAKEA